MRREHLSRLDAATKDLARRALAAGVPTYLISDEQVCPGAREGMTGLREPESPTPRASVLSSHAGRIKTGIKRASRSRGRRAFPVAGVIAHLFGISIPRAPFGAPNPIEFL
jgi:hypothetical protein